MKRLYRSNSNKVLAGVCGGIGEYFDIDPTVVRLGAVLMAIFTGGIPMILVYIIAMMVMPESNIMNQPPRSRY